MTTHHKSQTLAFARRDSVIAFIATLLTSCATDLPMSGEMFQILDLHCNPDRSLAATALMRVPGAFLETEGELLYSPDGGISWSLAPRDRDLRGIAPRFFTDPREAYAASLPLVVTGYKSSGFQWTYELDGWMKSTDSGRTWKAIPPGYLL